MIQSVWSFLSTIVVAAITAAITVRITQRIIAYWEGRKRIEQTKLSLYMSWMPFLADCYARARYPDAQPHDPKEFLRKQMEFLGTLQIMGPGDAIGASLEFFDLAERGFVKDASFDPDAFHGSFTQLNYWLCCEIHDERPVEKQVLPMKLKVGDRLTDETGEWEISGPPYTKADGKIVVSVQRNSQPKFTQLRTWNAHERISIKRHR